MQKRLVISLVVLSLVVCLTGCSHSTPLQDAMNDYSIMIESGMPEDLRLTIYYIDPTILTRRPLNQEDLVTFPGVEVIIVDSEEVAPHWEQLKELSPSVLQPVQEQSYVNARLYYVFEAGNSGKILEVVISEIRGSVFVNGVEVEGNPVFYDLIIHFLTDADRDILGI